MGLALFVRFFLYFLALQIQMQTCNGCIEKERIGLLEMKAYFVATIGDIANTLLDSWVDDTTSNCCSWERIKCNNITTGRVTDLSLNYLNYYDLKPSLMLNVSLFRPFEELRSLDLSVNFYEGWIPSEGFLSLKKLETLDLSLNRLNSSILLGLQKLNNLKMLDLSYNYMNGSIEGLQKLNSLKALDLSYNYMNGSIEGLCKMKNLVELSLYRNMFSGQIPGCLRNLTKLHVLDLSYNLFSGNFSSFTVNLTSLEYLSLCGNYLRGSFSLTTLANHSNLQALCVTSYSFEAQVETEKTQWFPTFQLKALILRACNLNRNIGSTIPSFLLYQKDLQYIDLSHNKLIGAFPYWLIQNNSRLGLLYLDNNSFVGNLQLPSIRRDINVLDISHNNMSGLLPKDIGTLFPRMEILNLAMNNFKGHIPASMGKIQNLLYLDLSHNSFTGEFHQQLGMSLVMLRLSNNFLQGNIPKFSNLTELHIKNNNLNVTLKQVLANLNSQVLQWLDISNNSISGEIPSSIGQFSKMEYLLMAENQLEGEIPLGFSNLTLRVLDLSQNKLFGSVSHFNLSFMHFLYLQKNAFSGSIPLTFSEGSRLVTLNLRNNNLSGIIPSWIDELSNLHVLLLGGNNFHGHIPIELCQLKNITIMDLSHNKINGSIPSCFNNFSFGRIEDGPDTFMTPLQFYTTTWNGSFISTSVHMYMSATLVNYFDYSEEYAEFRTKSHDYSYTGGILEYMTGMDLSCNMLTGIIPSQIGELQQIKALNLSHNYLSDSIPITFSNLTQIESLDLSYNNLSGEIPSELTHLNFLSVFNVSYNNLCGILPSGWQFGNFDDENYRGNPCLCGPLLKQKCEGSTASPPTQFNNTGEKETILDMVAFYWSFIASYITILLAFITVLCVNPHWRIAWFYFIGKVICRCFPTFPLY